MTTMLAGANGGILTCLVHSATECSSLPQGSSDDLALAADETFKRQLHRAEGGGALAWPVDQSAVIVHNRGMGPAQMIESLHSF